MYLFSSIIVKTSYIDLIEFEDLKKVLFATSNMLYMKLLGVEDFKHLIMTYSMFETLEDLKILSIF